MAEHNGAPTLPARLVAARERRGLKQAEIAARIGVSQSAVSQWESGTCVPRKHVGAVEREYGVRISRADLAGKAAA
jgi:transcriptional regulator with XRE-family HTH domain